jgi:peroxiredoxin Q/BCP
MYTIGQTLPDFTALIGAEQPLSLAALRGRWLVLYFYPRDDTPGCTLESQAFRDLYPALQALGVEVVGISRDTLSSHAKFSAKYQLPFPLIADPEEQLCNTFGVMVAKTMYGKPVRGIERSTFLLDPQGVLRAVWRKVKVEGHAAEVLATLQTLQA